MLVYDDVEWGDLYDTEEAGESRPLDFGERKFTKFYTSPDIADEINAKLDILESKESRSPLSAEDVEILLSDLENPPPEPSTESDFTDD